MTSDSPTRSRDEVEVDVCILTWNTRETSLASLRRLVASDQGVPFRVLVRDNGSTDGTVEALMRELPSIELEAGSTNIGYAAGMNALVRRATAPFVLLLNSDAWPEDGALRRLVEAARAHPDAALVVPRVLRPDGSLEHSTWPWPSLRLSALYAFGLHRLVPRVLARRMLFPPAWQHDESRYVPWAMGAAWLLPRTVFESVGPLDERFFMYGEDIEWCLRAHRHGLRTWFEAGAVIRHVGNASADRRYEAGVATMKAAASDRVMRQHHGRVVGAGYRWLETLFYGRLWLVARLRRDHGQAAYCRSVVAGHLHGPSDSGAP